MRALLCTLTLIALPALSACTSTTSLVADAGTDAPPPCPADPPAEGAPCTTPMACSWLRCAAGGAITTVCTAGAWTRREAPCPIDCGGQTCADGQICAVFEGGAQIHMCMDDPCDGAALEACMCEVCASGTDGCRRNEHTVTCRVDCGAAVCP